MQIKKLTSAETLFQFEQANFKNFYSLESCSQELSNPAKTYFYIDQNGQPIAYIGIMEMIDEAEILRIAVNDQHRKKGIAQNLFNFTLKYLEQKNIKNIFLEVSDKNRIAYNFYLKNNFKVINTRKNYYSDNSNAIIMQRGIK